MSDKILIVEGRQDKYKFNRLLAEDIPILCTNGTISASNLEELIDPI